ncbi:zinc finger protein RFP-like [Sinocyclocheilus anshuiensis]|uniref:zinc finger protein RFP-like n=1 Tax=Sinocyclocheilus anshuiensis TaxID=1608454 RepID=UPI0007B7DC4C|nr:PREDICTED: zinc finger protein RFP-like [Sinocyclocheilus anshuiensis]
MAEFLPTSPSQTRRQRMDKPPSMSSSSGPLAEELQCSVCLEVFTDPVSTPCGHNFCKSCLNQCWDNSQKCYCPFCKETFSKKTRPQDQHLESKSEVLCDICDERRLKALKSCLLCQASYCKTHLDLHQRVLSLKKHKLMDPVKNMKDYICQKHERPLELFCRDDQTYVCVFCTDGDHKTHNTVPLEEESKEKKKWKIHVKKSDKMLNTDVSVETLRRALTQLQETLDQKLSQTVLMRMQQYAVDVTLDPDTAHPYVILSDDGKQVIHGDIKQKLPNNQKRFDHCTCVLGKDGFSSGRFYFEVQVNEKTKWDLGVAKESINRKGKVTVSPQDGFWVLGLWNENEYWACTDSYVLLSLRVKPQKVGVFVDYEEGLVSFYNVESKSHIYSFTGQSFTEKLYPLFSPCRNEKGTNSAPLIISSFNSNE